MFFRIHLGKHFVSKVRNKSTSRILKVIQTHTHLNSNLPNKRPITLNRQDDVSYLLILVSISWTRSLPVYSFHCQRRDFSLQLFFSFFWLIHPFYRRFSRLISFQAKQLFFSFSAVVVQQLCPHSAQHNLSPSFCLDNFSSFFLWNSFIQKERV